MTPAGAFILYICCKRAAKPRRNAPRAMAISLDPRRGDGPLQKFKASATTYFRMTRNHTRTRTPEAPFTEILIPKGNEGHEETGNKEESDRNNARGDFKEYIGEQSCTPHARRKSGMFFHISPLT